MTAEFGAYLKHVRMAKDISQSRLADLAWLDHSYVSRLEGGSREPSRAAVDKIADVLELDRDTLRRIAFGYAEDSTDIQRLRDALSTLPTVQRGLLERQVRALVDTAEYYATIEGVQV